MNKAILVLILAMLAACNKPQKTWGEHQSISNSKWQAQTPLVFNMPVTQKDELYDIFIDVRNRTDYSYSNLYLFITTESPGGLQSVDTISYDLAYQDGQWKGNGFMSKYKENSFVFRQYIRFPEEGNYTIKVRQGMREETLNGISSLGLQLIKHKQN